MCLNYLKVNSVSPYGAKVSFVPCGHCAECAESSCKQWSFRLISEALTRQDKGWLLGFFTLTYNPAFLPHVPQECFYDDGFVGPRSVACFNRLHVTQMIKNIRKYLHKHYRITQLAYIVCSELGEHTKRPHYHGLIMWPPIDGVDAKLIHSLIERYWPYGFIGPRYWNGDRKHQPFQVSCAKNSAFYASKYCCKDLAYEKYAKCNGVDLRCPVMKNFKPFHVQSRGLGASWLNGKSFEDLKKALTVGWSFIGDTALRTLPLYLRNKILFKSRYDVINYKDGSCKRLVRREPTNFFKENYKDVFEKKVSFYRELFTKVANVDFWHSLGVSSSFIDYYRGALSSLRLDDLARYCVAYYGVDSDVRRYDVDIATAWFSRYDSSILDNKSYVNNAAYRFNAIQYDEFITMVLSEYGRGVSKDFIYQRELQRVRDFYNSDLTTE